MKATIDPPDVSAPIPAEAAAEAVAQPAQAAPAPPVLFARWFPTAVVTVEADLQERFLGEDLDAVCMAAAAAGDARLVATAAQPLAARRESLHAWRAKRIVEAHTANPEFAQYFAQAAAETQAAMRAGEVPLIEIDRSISTFIAEAARLRMESLNASKARLRKAVTDVLMDCDGSEVNMVVPGFIAIREDGEVGIFRRRGRCVEWARSTGGRYLLAAVDRADLNIHSGAEAD